MLTGAMMMNAVFADTDFKKPIFYLEFNIYGAGAEIRLNDIPIYYHDAEGKTSSQKPIPESIVDGENVLTVKSFTFKEDKYEYKEGAYVEVSISVREKDAPFNDAKTLLQLKLNPTNPKNSLLENTVAKYGDKDAVILDFSEKQIVAERRIYIKSPFPRWGWQNGKIIENTPENFSSLMAVYKEIWGALNAGDKTRVRELYDPAAQEFAWAYHYQEKKYGHRVMNTGGLIDDDDWGLADIDKLIDITKYRMEIFANGLIAQVIDQDRRTPIMYYNKNVKMLNIQKFGFYKNKAGEWVMIR